MYYILRRLFQMFGFICWSWSSISSEVGSFSEVSPDQDAFLAEMILQDQALPPVAPEIPVKVTTEVPILTAPPVQVTQDSEEETPLSVPVIAGIAAGGAIAFSAIIAAIMAGYKAYQNSQKPKTIYRYLDDMLQLCVKNEKNPAFVSTYEELKPIHMYIEEHSPLDGIEAGILFDIVSDKISYGITGVSNRNPGKINLRSSTRLLASLKSMSVNIGNAVEAMEPGMVKSEYERQSGEDIREQIYEEIDENRGHLKTNLQEYQDAKNKELIALDRVQKNLKSQATSAKILKKELKGTSGLADFENQKSRRVNIHEENLSQNQKLSNAIAVKKEVVNDFNFKERRNRLYND